ncbi:hypothetical protein ABIE64_002227 [Thalassospira sp. MBR-102]|jgi:hypothetical protein|uniref:hypothetical protein n=1 Tax=Thalassospira sp. MBR-102 TaxID=3156466 RepID=UPI0033980341
MADNVVFEKEIINPLVDITSWDDHQSIVVGVHRKFTFNSTAVQCLIEIQQPDPDCLDDFRVEGDFTEICAEETIHTTASGARLLAQALLEAADVAEKAMAGETSHE